MTTRLLRNVHLATMVATPQDPWGSIRNAALVLQGEHIAWAGPLDALPVQAWDEEIDGQGSWVTPGLIDCHTHLVYGGNRADEFEQRLEGVAYEEIARRGGGILSTVRATREASEEALFHSAARRLQCFLREGVTGIEIKSGYGLDTESELKMLRVARRLERDFPVTVSTTFLGAHALPPEFPDNDSYIEHLCHEMLPEVARSGLADAVDIFCEGIGFDTVQTRRYLETARALALPCKIHAEQLSNLGGTALAAEFGARSADHLEYLDADGIAAMSRSGTAAVLLPGAFYFLRERQLPPVEALREAGVPIAIASDCNPGSSPALSLLLMLNMACSLFRLTPAEAVAGVTRHAAQALGWQDRVGVLAEGMQADLALWNVEHPAELCYHIGGNPCVGVFKGGQRL